MQNSPSAVSETGTLGGPEAVLRKTRELQPLRPAELDARSLNAYSVKGSKPAHAQLQPQWKGTTPTIHINAHVHTQGMRQT